MSDATTLADRQKWVARLQLRDPAVFDAWVVEEYPGVYGLVSRLLGWQQDCDDVVQNVFIAAWNQIGKFRGDAEVRTWLHAIAVNQCRRERRRWRLRRLRFRTLEPDVVEAPKPSDTSDLGFAQIQQAIGRLSQRDREMIVLCGLQQRSVEEVSQMLQLRKNTVEVRLHRARQRLQGYLDAARHATSMMGPSGDSHGTP